MEKLLQIPRKHRKRLNLLSWLRYRKIDRNQTLAEASLKEKGVNFRQTGADAARDNYGQMNKEEFENINSRQQWVNWILIGKCLHNQVPDRPLNVLDIGCGSGTSTTVLASYLPIGSVIIANDISENLIEAARTKDYICAHTGQSTKPSFIVQDATMPFRDSDNTPIAPNSVDYFNSSGIVGHHFSPEAFATMAKNATEAIKSGGHAAIDEGPGLGEDVIVPEMIRQGWTFLRPVRLLPWKKQGQLLFRWDRES